MYIGTHGVGLFSPQFCDDLLNELTSSDTISIGLGAKYGQKSDTISKAKYIASAMNTTRYNAKI